MRNYNFRVGDRVWIHHSSAIRIGTVVEVLEFGFRVEEDGLKEKQIVSKWHLFRYPEDALHVEQQLEDDIMCAQMDLKSFRDDYTVE